MAARFQSRKAELGSSRRLKLEKAVAAGRPQPALQRAPAVSSSASGEKPPAIDGLAPPGPKKDVPLSAGSPPDLQDPHTLRLVEINGVPNANQTRVCRLAGPQTRSIQGAPVDAP